MNFMSQVRHRLQPDPAELVMKELRETPEAVALAKTCGAAREQVSRLDRPAKDSPYWAAYHVILDAYWLTHDALSDLIHFACVSQGCERGEVVSTGEIIDLLGCSS